jgi:hypothetical protein
MKKISVLIPILMLAMVTTMAQPGNTQKQGYEQFKSEYNITDKQDKDIMPIYQEQVKLMEEYRMLPADSKKREKVKKELRKLLREMNSQLSPEQKELARQKNAMRKTNANQ